MKEAQRASEGESAALSAAVGIATVKKCFDPQKLQRRYDIARRWLTKGIEPEVAYHDESIS